jgi:AraC-like DNA-binding protein
MKLYIKYMVSFRCKLLVKEELKKLGLHYVTVDLGMADIMEEISDLQRERFKSALRKSGLELMEDKKAILIERIKDTIIEMIHYTEEHEKLKFSHYLVDKLHVDYTHLAKLFSETEGRTIEHFIILHKIERVKELILYNELSLSEIAFKLHYSSVSALSNQFKKTTGLTPTFFKTLIQNRRIQLEDL